MLITVILVIILFTLLFTTSNSTTGPVGLIGRAIAPVQKWLYGATEGVGDFFGGLFTKSDAEKEAEQLREKVADLEGQLREYDQIKSENERLNDLLKVAKDYEDYDLVTARVIGNVPGGFFEEFTVNVGSDQGIKKDMIVLTKDGLLGKVKSTRPTFSTVVTLVSSNSGVAAVVDGTRDQGIVKRSDDDTGSELKMLYLPHNATVEPGGKVYTSGVGGVFPRGIYIGQIVKVSTPSSTERVAYIKSDVDFERVEEVMIIKQVFDEVT